MKKIMFLMLLMMSMSVNAQNSDSKGDTYPFYIDVEPFVRSMNSYAAHIILSERSPLLICDENDEILEFNQEIQIFNYLSKAGWTYVDVLPNGKDYIFKKVVKDEDQIKKELNLKTTDEIKRIQKEKKGK